MPALIAGTHSSATPEQTVRWLRGPPSGVFLALVARTHRAANSAAIVLAGNAANISPTDPADEWVLATNARLSGSHRNAAIGTLRHVTTDAFDRAGITLF
jgi:hypothetical protein